jgi:hypothetical protein
MDGIIEVIKPDYGILSVVERTRKVGRPLMWRCFPIKNIDVQYRTWRDADPMGRYDVIVTMCEFEMHVQSGGKYHIYHGRRAKQVAYCNNFKAAWKKIAKGEKYMCLDGEPFCDGNPMFDGKPRFDKQLNRMVATWTWDKIMTKKGCYGFWDGYDCTSF